MKDREFDICMAAKKQAKIDKLPFWPELAEKLGYATPEALRAAFRREAKKRKIGESSVAKEIGEFKKFADGTYSSDRLIQIFESDLNDDRALLKAHNLDPEKWTLIESTSNMWHAQRAYDKGQLVQFQSKIRVKPKTVWEISEKDVLEFYSKKEFAVAPLVTRKYKKQDVRRVLEICFADWHIGARWYDKNWSDLETIFPNTFSDILGQAEGMEFSEIWLVPLGDIFHFENRQQQTERHQQTVDSNGMNPLEMYDMAKRLFVSAIDSSLEIAPVRTWYVPGNHDGITLYHLLCDLESYYRHNKSYSTVLSHTATKWELFGENLIAWEHGEMPKKNKIHWLATDAASDWGRSKYREIHWGHLHSEEVSEFGGLKRRRLPALAPKDYWHHRNGYTGSIRATMAFVWEENRIGFKQMWQSTGI